MVNKKSSFQYYWSERSESGFSVILCMWLKTLRCCSHCISLIVSLQKSKKTHDNRNEIFDEYDKDKEDKDKEIEDLRQQITNRENTIKKLRRMNLELQEGTKHCIH